LNDAKDVTETSIHGTKQVIVNITDNVLSLLQTTQVILEICAALAWVCCFKSMLATTKLGFSQKTLQPPWCPKLVTGLVVSWQMPFIHVLFLNCCFSNKYVFHVHVNAQASHGNVIVI